MMALHSTVALESTGPLIPTLYAEEPDTRDELTQESYLLSTIDWLQSELLTLPNSFCSEDPFEDDSQS